MTTKTETQYQHLEPRPGSNYRQLWLKGRRIRAAVVDEVIHGPDPRSPEEFARDYQVPLQAVLEALDYVAAKSPAHRARAGPRSGQAPRTGSPRARARMRCCSTRT